MRFWFLALLLILPGFAHAEARCHAQINGVETLIEFDRSSDAASNITFREAATRGPGRLWSWAWGDAPACNSAVLIGELEAGLPAEEIAGYCLVWLEEADGWVLAPGARNFRGRCNGVICQTVTASTAEIAAATAGIGGIIGGGTAAAQAAGVSAVAHSSGALILTGSSGYIAGTLGAVGTTFLAAVTAPAALAAGAATVVVGGGALFVCSG